MADEDEKSPSRKDRDKIDYRKAGLGVMIPAMLAACVVVGVMLGNMTDKWLGSTPWGVLIGLFLGMAAGVREIIRLVNKMDGNGDKGNKKK